MRLARGERILFADADGASRFADLDLLEAALNQNLTKSGHGLALGSRAHLVDTAAVVQVCLTTSSTWLVIIVIIFAAVSNPQLVDEVIPFLPSHSGGRSVERHAMWLQALCSAISPAHLSTYAC